MIHIGMILSIKSTRKDVVHNCLAYALLYFCKRVIKEMGHAHIIIESEHDPQYIKSELDVAYGPLTIFILDEDSAELSS